MAADSPTVLWFICSNLLLASPHCAGGATEGAGAGGNADGAGRRARPLGGREAEDGLPQLWCQEGARARPEARAGEVPADPGGGRDD